MDGDRCYGCSGTGKQAASRKVGALMVEYSEAVRHGKHPIVGALSVGDNVLPGLAYTAHGEPWVQVTAIGEYEGACGWTNYGTAEEIVTAWYVTVSLSDGTTKSVSTGQLCRRQWMDTTGLRQRLIDQAWASLTKAQRAAVVNEARS